MHRALAAALVVSLAACQSPHSERRERLEKLVGVPESIVEEIEADCAAGRAPACTSLGIQHAFGTHGRRQDHAAAIPHLQKGCDGGDPHGCHELGVMYMYGRGVAQDDATARALFERACAARIANSCHYLGDLFATGRGAPKDPVQASTWYAKACAAGSESSCGK